jgi:hypothetical protein
MGAAWNARAGGGFDSLKQVIVVCKSSLWPSRLSAELIQRDAGAELYRQMQAVRLTPAMR